jgi:nucleoid-associated protein Lsr2
MAKSTITQVTDDIDGSADAETVRFAFQGASYSIDLAAKNLDKLTKALAPFIEHASKYRGTSASTRRKPGAKAVRSYDLVQLREWAGKNKIQVPGRGRIPGSVVDQYLAAGGH